MVIGDDHVHSVFFGPLTRLKTSNAAIDRDTQRKSVGFRLFQRWDIYAVALCEAIRNVKPGFSTEHFEGFAKQDRPRRSVDVIVAPHKDLFFIFDRAMD